MIKVASKPRRAAKRRVPTKVVTGFPDSTPLLSDPEALRARGERDGFLFFKQLLPKEPLLEVRRQILEIVARNGWLKKGTKLMDGIGDIAAIARSDKADKALKYIGVGRQAYIDIQSLEDFHLLAHHPRLLALYRTLFKGPVLPHPRNIARVLLPAPSFAPTPPHQDYIYIQGAHSFWTCWFPLGDCPMSLGGLSLLRGSHREDVLKVAKARGAGGFESLLCDMDYTWFQDDYECGDVVTFPSHLVHKALPNRQKGRIRLSCDFRYQPARDKVHRSSLMPHMGGVRWRQLYKGWKNPRLKYYWKSKAKEIKAWDWSLLKASDRIC
jgi:Phytanoyl-CoA dioxygenase (PhyH)